MERKVDTPKLGHVAVRMRAIRSKWWTPQHVSQNKAGQRVRGVLLGDHRTSNDCITLEEFHRRRGLGEV